jgi:prepilin-type N-terminal cleavage/methylation domain-containing protein
MTDGRECGFTIVEVLAAIGVISVCTALLGGLFSSSFRAIAGSREELELTAEFLKIDALIRAEAGAVVIPYWERGAGIVQDEQGITVHWYGGIRENTLRIGKENGNIIVETSGGSDRETHILPGAADRINIVPLEGSSGFDISAETRGKLRRSEVYFSSVPLKGNNP